MSHGLNLLVKDIFAATKTRKPPSNELGFPDGYPFEHLLEFANNCKDVVKFFCNHHLMKVGLENLQKKAGVKSLVKPAPTRFVILLFGVPLYLNICSLRWGTVLGCFQSIMDSERLLHQIVTERDFVSGSSKQKEERQSIKTFIVADSFVELLRKSIAILTPIDKLIVKYQSDSVPVSEVLVDFTYTQMTGFGELSQSIISANEHNYLVHLTRQRYLNGDAHGMGYLLDPRFIGERFSPQMRQAIEDQLFSFPNDGADDPGFRQALFQQYTDFVISARTEKANNSFRYEMLVKRVKTPIQYWLADGAQWPYLQSVALKLFSLATSTASCERSFSNQ